MYVETDACSWAPPPFQPSSEETGDRNRGAKSVGPIFILISQLVGSVGFEHSTNKTKWQLLALAEAHSHTHTNPPPHTHTHTHTHTLGSAMGEETYREAVWEIKVSLSWPNTVRLSSDQPLRRGGGTAEDGGRLKTGHFSSVRLAASETALQDLKEQTRR